MISISCLLQDILHLLFTLS